MDNVIQCILHYEAIEKERIQTEKTVWELQQEEWKSSTWSSKQRDVLFNTTQKLETYQQQMASFFSDLEHVCSSLSFLELWQVKKFLLLQMERLEKTREQLLQKRIRLVQEDVSLVDINKSLEENQELLQWYYILSASFHILFLDAGKEEELKKQKVSF